MNSLKERKIPDWATAFHREQAKIKAIATNAAA
jgi:hypothetical protein